MFAVASDLGEGVEFGLRDVLTWPTFGDMLTFCDPNQKFGPSDGFVKEVQLGERGAVVGYGMWMPFTAVREEAEAWPVKLGNDRFVRAFRPGQTLTVLHSEWDGGEGAALWTVFGTAAGRVMVTEDGVQETVTGP